MILNLTQVKCMYSLINENCGILEYQLLKCYYLVQCEFYSGVILFPLNSKFMKIKNRHNKECLCSNVKNDYQLCQLTTNLLTKSILHIHTHTMPLNREEQNIYLITYHHIMCPIVLVLHNKHIVTVLMFKIIKISIQNRQVKCKT